MIGIDEVGRGCWAGPLLVVAARQLRPLPAGLKDSKVLAKKRRELLKFDIELACELGEGWVMPAEIDHLGLTKAMQLAVARALEALDAKPGEQIVMDGSINYCDPKFYKAAAVVDADALFPLVSAASIYAKVQRDDYMARLPERYAVYEFERHVGYGTARHKLLLERHGVSDQHRRSFAPVKALL